MMTWTKKGETLEELRARLDREHKEQGYYCEAPFDYTIRAEWPRISEALREMREFIEGVGISCGKEDEGLARELLARLDAPEKTP